VFSFARKVFTFARKVFTFARNATRKKRADRATIS